MFTFAHVGITLGAARGLEKAIAVLRGAVDYRLVLLGSMLPDIIDKPLGGLVLREELGNGRIYCHTLAFLLLLWGAGAALWCRRKNHGLLVLAGSCTMHHVLDGMWFYPVTFLWPLYGWGLPRDDPGTWLQQWVANLITNPVVYVPEMLGGFFILYIFSRVLIRKEWGQFWCTGRLNF